MRYSIPFLIIIALTSCTSENKDRQHPVATTDSTVVTAAPDSLTNDSSQPATASNAIWAHEYIAFYVEKKYTEKQLTDEHVSFMTDTATMYGRAFVYARIGTNQPDRFVTHEHIYVDAVTRLIYTYDVVNDTLLLWESPYNLNPTTGIPDNGQYRFDIYFTEHGDKPAGEKISVSIMNDTATIVYEGNGKLSLGSAGTIHAKGKLYKHKSGQWIILRHPNDMSAPEIGGCTDGPRTLDFKNRKYKIC